MTKKILLSAFIFVSGCQTFKTERPEIKSRSENRATPSTKSPSSPLETKDYILVETEDEKTDPPSSVTPAQQPTSAEAPPATLPPQQIPKIALILGPGGAKSFAHIGVLQEFQKSKVPVYAVAGIEFAAPMAALYAWKGFVNDVEWQMSKLKESDVLKKSLISNQIQSGDISQVNDFLKLVFHGLKVEELKKPFVCPALNLERNQIHMMSRGSLEDLLPHCWAYPPLFKPHNKSVAAVRDLRQTADFLRSKGANLVVFVNVLGGNASKKSIGSLETAEGVLWAEMISEFSKPQLGVDAMISLNLENYNLTNFDKRPEIIQKGAEQARSQIGVLSQRLGL